MSSSDCPSASRHSVWISKRLFLSFLLLVVFSLSFWSSRGRRKGSFCSKKVVVALESHQSTLKDWISMAECLPLGNEGVAAKIGIAHQEDKRPANRGRYGESRAHITNR
ncbi:hypothetical protein CEXT_294481 [Caerostris extrusa]|uniref:Uncharacterized protein n=1 Tax=Caerostris extrusa TaxID=172846 RepID=A0AAV4QKZ6_CAEEX|nr:hypothetical protein CEXT_294481 [Caerostris extrusa]